MNKKLQINLTGLGRAQERVVASLTSEHQAIYGNGLLARQMCERMAQGFEVYLKPMQVIWPHSWRVLTAASQEAFFVEMTTSDATQEPVEIVMAVTTPGGFASFGYYYGFAPHPTSDEEDMEDVLDSLARLPDFIKQLSIDFAHVYVNTTSDVRLLPDVMALADLPYSSRAITGHLPKGKKCPAGLKRFSNLDDVQTMSYRRTDPAAWRLFYDRSPEGDKTIFAALGDSFERIWVLNDAQEAMDRMCEHYLLGAEGEFDFRPFLSDPA